MKVNAAIRVPTKFVEEPFCVSEKIGDRKILCIRGEGYHDSPSKLFCFKVPNHFVGEPFCVSEIFWYRKMLRIRERPGGSIRIFHRKFDVSQYRKTSKENPSWFQKNSGIETLMHKRGRYHDFPSY